MYIFIFYYIKSESIITHRFLSYIFEWSSSHSDNISWPGPHLRPSAKEWPFCSLEGPPK